MIYVVTRTAEQGKRAGFSSVAGVALGNLGNALAASFGLAALFATSAIAFTIVKFAGAAYLIYLGFLALRRSRHAAIPIFCRHQKNAVIFRDGFTISLLNPKTAIFFASFLPLFLESPDQFGVRGLLLASTFILIAALSDSAYVFGTSVLRSKLSLTGSVQRFGRYASAFSYFGLGVVAATSGSRTGR